MEDNKSLSTVQQKTAFAEQLWLFYFNQYLYENGMITKSQRNRMHAKIDSHKGSISYKKQKQQTQQEALLMA